jgi:hypothetical protein
MFVSDLCGLLGTMLCFAVALAYLGGCHALRRDRYE